MIGKFIYDAPVPGKSVSTITFTEGNPWVCVSYVPAGMTADQAIDLGHRLVDAGLRAKRA